MMFAKCDKLTIVLWGLKKKQPLLSYYYLLHRIHNLMIE